MLGHRGTERAAFHWISLNLSVYTSVFLVKWDKLLNNVKYFTKEEESVPVSPLL